MRTPRPAEAFHPGVFVEEELEARDWSRTDLAAILGRDVSLVSDLIAQKRSVTPETAQGLADAFGTSYEYWSNLQAAHDQWKLEHDSDTVQRRARLFSIAPVNEMLNRGWIESTSSLEVLEHRVCRFFDIGSADDDPVFLRHAARRTMTYDEPEAVVRAWLFKAKSTALSAPVTGKFSASALEKAIPQLRALAASPQEIRKAPGILAERGVRLVVVEKLPKSRIDGVCFWLDATSPAIALSLRFDRIDYFWHTLFHEIDHVRHGHGKRGKYFAVDRNWEAISKDQERPQEEIDADLFASSILIDSDRLEGFIMRKGPLYSAKNLKLFAELVGVHPGTLVGQLQYLGEIPYSHHRRLLVPVRKWVIDYTLTDGFGHFAPLAI